MPFRWPYSLKSGLSRTPFIFKKIPFSSPANGLLSFLLQGFAHVRYSYPAFAGLRCCAGNFVAPQHPFAPRVCLTRRSRLQVNRPLDFRLLGRVWWSAVLQTLIIAKRECNRNNEKLKVWAKCNVMVACLVTHCKMPRIVIATVYHRSVLLH